MFLMIGILLLIVWCTISVAVRRHWRLWEKVPPRRISEIQSVEIAKISGWTRAHSSERVYAPLSGDAVLFCNFEGRGSWFWAWRSSPLEFGSCEGVTKKCRRSTASTS